MIDTGLRIERSSNPKQKPDPEQLSFGKVFTDHMFVMDYTEEKGWHDPRIVPYGSITLDPAAMVFHYGQTVFEGLKAYRTNDDRILLFRPEKNIQRLNRSCHRISIPQIPEEAAIDYLVKLLQVDRDWVPSAEGTSLYIRPFVFANEINLSAVPSTEYTFMIILSPVGSYYKEGIQPVNIYVEDEFTRAVRGGTGTAKTGGNYSASYIAQEKAAEKGYAQVMWLDGIEKKYIEEVGSMNVFFKIDGEIVTPILNGSILEGVTRMSIIELLRDWGYPVAERKISMEELFAAYEKGKLEEAFGTGTAAVVSPIGQLNWKEHQMVINDKRIGELSKKLYDTLTGIQRGQLPDPFNWNREVNE
ncbi:branched-chain amino acid aminotransferase [Halalkalibacterium halodurans]|jgi:branched-chain amino acid aminotransferase|uniref:Branched-chain-amino-acid aminotransferase n=2 Tax=Halalkalibacterium halodurans TaxID=86665 RepID=Q9KAY0_HALH5|nr:branched-chain amino acid aminotransferase [Halalkalibacterium halodurans]MDY7222712.1 branched-chain amino acid aminotransferase [Halalkalibacterium halodurans]MDY7241933.1 branched-chain amino acid aminotransferase [Halalkalibacterium halodurans]MED3647167.1 branched-chain amino acid aminotransferase [Halalkalibacterium halodurans]MED4123628.1 branched-chain amino acid aminotransferase [Halalkalibacterium halodurans]TES52858.1 branched-chain amino acid aminotransferase [Halalkalibacterium